MARSIGGSRLPPVLVDGVCTVYFPCSLQLVATRAGSFYPGFSLFTPYSNKVNTGVGNLIQVITPNVALYAALSTTILRLTHAMLHSSLV
jgi:hypothetical protein